MTTIPMPSMPQRLRSYHTTGSSQVSQKMDESIRRIASSYEQSRALFGEKADTISQLNTLWAECSEKGWDGDDAYPLKREAADIATQLIRVFPDHLPMPELAPEPDGCISLDWMRSRQQVLSLSIGSTQRIAYAWINGTDKGYGVARFDGEGIPQQIEEILRRILQ